MKNILQGEFVVLCACFEKIIVSQIMLTGELSSGLVFFLSLMVELLSSGKLIPFPVLTWFLRIHFYFGLQEHYLVNVVKVLTASFNINE